MLPIDMLGKMEENRERVQESKHTIAINSDQCHQRKSVKSEKERKICGGTEVMEESG